MCGTLSIEEQDEVLLIHQYQKPFPILVAGYVSQGEALEAACIRELKEETNLDAIKVTFLRSQYYEPSQTLMVNFEVLVDRPNFILNEDGKKIYFYKINLPQFYHSFKSNYKNL